MPAPNVLFVITDDQNPETINARGNGETVTPNLDRLAGRGCFLRPYTTAPVCMPGRTEIMSGRNAFRNGCRDNGEFVDDSLTLLPEALGEAGYHTFLSGKWHEICDPDEQFDETHRVLYADNENRMAEDGHTMRFEEDEPVEGEASRLVTDRGVAFLEDPPEGPWFAQVGLSAPHIPHTPPAEFADHYTPEETAVPPNFAPEPPVPTGTQTRLDELVEDYPRTPAAIRERRADYYAMVTSLDHQVGRLLAALDRAGLAEETIVVFTADHGLAVGSHGLTGKNNLYEHTARVPTVIAGPGVPTGQPSVLCGHYDLFPTLFELLDLAVPETVEGTSYADALDGGEHREAVFGAYGDGQRMVRRGRWKLIDYPQAGETQLFDLAADPHETSNLLAEWRLELLGEDPEAVDDRVGPWRRQREPGWQYERAADPEAIETAAAELRERLRAWQREMDDPLVA